jgi:lipoprotein-releasing system permease protein
MYKFLLCWRYLRTRYIALASIVSVTLGVATMIVVNAVMQGFTQEMYERLHSILSDVVIEAHSLEGFPDPIWHMEQVKRIIGDDVVGMTPTVHVPAMLSFQYGGQWVTRPVQLIGIDEKTQAAAGDFQSFLQHPANRQSMTFDLRDGGFNGVDHQAKKGEGANREALKGAGMERRRNNVKAQRGFEADVKRHQEKQANRAEQAPVVVPEPNIFDRRPKEPQPEYDPLKPHTGVVLGIALATYRDKENRDRFLVLPGDDVKLTFPTAGTPPKALDDVFTVVDFYECKMSEYDSSFVFVPINKLQELRGMIDPQSGTRFVTAIQVKLRPGVDNQTVRNKLRKAFPPELVSVLTWQDKQGPLLSAVQMETRILNLLLFMIVAVAGFGILAIFFMIVVEKTKDIGILKSLGASSSGIMGIFVGYGLLLGIVGAGGGMVIGLLFVANIDRIADVLSWLTGKPVFDPQIYYFFRIPTIVDPFTVSWIVAGALAIAVMASVLPARRASRLHPVEALRYE